MSETTKETVFFTMVQHPINGWTRVGNAYTSYNRATGWLSFVRGAWSGCKVKVSQFTAVWVDGELTDKSVKTLDEKYNLDPCAAPETGPAEVQP
jgi:hypothetical protein